MAIAKNAFTALVSQSLAAGASINTAEWNLVGSYSGRLFIKLTNGASAPTTAPTVKFFSGEATGIKRQLWTASGDTVNSSVTEPNNLYELCDMFGNATITNGATNAITVEAYGQQDTGI